MTSMWCIEIIGELNEEFLMNLIRRPVAKGNLSKCSIRYEMKIDYSRKCYIVFHDNNDNYSIKIFQKYFTRNRYSKE